MIGRPVHILEKLEQTGVTEEESQTRGHCIRGDGHADRFAKEAKERKDR